MPNHKVPSRRLAFFLLLPTLLCFRAQARVHCNKQWGPANASSAKSCKVTQKAEKDPSSILIKGLKWSYNVQNLALRVKINNPELLSGLKLNFYKSGSVQASYTLPLYTDPEYNILQDNQETILSIPVSNLEWQTTALEKGPHTNPFDALTIYLATKDQGEKVLELEVSDLIYTNKAKKGQISITFDDGYKSNFKAAKIMEPLGLRGTAYIIPKAINQKGHLTESELKQMKHWGWSLSAHLTTPVTQIDNLSQVLTETKKKMTTLGSASGSNHFALPLGKYNYKVLNTLKDNFSSVRLAGGLVETLPVHDLYRLRTINVTQNMSPETVFKWCKKAIDNRDWAILMFHYLDKPQQGDLSYTSENFEKVMKMLKRYKSQVKTVEEVLDN